MMAIINGKLSRGSSLGIGEFAEDLKAHRDAAFVSVDTVGSTVCLNEC